MSRWFVILAIGTVLLGGGRLAWATEADGEPMMEDSMMEDSMMEKPMMEDSMMGDRDRSLRECACIQRELALLDGGYNEARRQLEQETDRVNGLYTDIVRMRQNGRVLSAGAELARYRELLRAYESGYREINEVRIPEHNRASSGYNSALRYYTDTCGQTFSWEEVRRAGQETTCVPVASPGGDASSGG